MRYQLIVQGWTEYTDIFESRLNKLADKGWSVSSIGTRGKDNVVFWALLEKQDALMQEEVEDD